MDSNLGRAAAARDDGLATISYLPGVDPAPAGHKARPHQAPRDDEQTARAANISMHALARRGVSSQEMARLLTSRDLDQQTVDAEVARLEGVGLLDDAALAETLVRTLRERKRLGRAALVPELRRRGIPKEIIDFAIGADTDQDELAMATALAVKRAPQVRSLDPETARRRLSGFLARKGYSGAVVGAAVKAALGTSGPAFR